MYANMGVMYETTRVRAREPGSRWMHHAEMDRAPLWQPETTVAQSSSDDTAICQRCPLSSRARFPLPDVLSRSFHNRCFHAIDTKPKDLRSSLVDARDPYDKIITHIEFVFFFFRIGRF